MLGTRLAFFTPGSAYLDRADFKDGVLDLRGQGTGPADASPLAFIAGDTAYEVTVDIELQGASQSGLLLFYDQTLFCGLGAEAGRLRTYKHGLEQDYPPPGPAGGRRMKMRVVNDEDVASFFVNYGQGWRRVVSYEVSGYNHNMADGFMSLRPALFAAGSGSGLFRSLEYRALRT
jgi:xylan 1,4-beta-xylosidase